MNGQKKRTSLMASGMAAVLSCVLLFSCNQEDFLQENTLEKAYDNICFGITSDESASTRGCAGSHEDGYTSGRFVLRSKDSADTLCVRVIVSDGIYLSDVDGKRAVTRGASVTKDNFYGSFHVLAYWKKSGTLVEEQFYMNETVTDKGDHLWSSTNTYYWPGAEHSLKFYAWAPTDAGFTSTPSTPTSTTLEYNVPTQAVDQKDIVVANPDETPGNHNAAQPLTFQHICTAVRFETGSQMQPGTIKSVALKGVRNRGTYDLATSKWNLNESTSDFSQTLNRKTTGTEANGTEITSAEGTFMMLPQTLPADVMVEVVFTNQAGQDRTLTASIANTEWKMGTTVTYKLSITPEYELEFISRPEVQDAHYVIYPLTIKADKLPEGGWTLTSDNTDEVTFVEKFTDNGIKNWVDQGYWLKDYCGTSTLTSSSAGEVQIYVFLKENISEEDRSITLSLTPANNSNATPATFTFNQYCPAWNNGIGVERIQEKDYPWGFNWDSSMKITYSMPGGLGSAIIHVLFAIFGNHSYVIDEGYAVSGTWKVTVDFSKVPKLTTATSTSDGLLNTWELYNFNGINEASTIMSQLESWGGTTSDKLPTNPNEFAAWACAKKNKYGIKSDSNGGQTVYVPTLEQTDMVWYLPAQEETPLMNDHLSGDYWTSTAITDPGTTAYKYTAGDSTSGENRNTPIHVRAIRKKP